MKIVPQYPKYAIAVTLAYSAAVGNGLLVAQSDETIDDSMDVFNLSPFVVETNDSEGYRATSTLAGSRLKTDLKDLATAVSVYTPEFLEDTGSTDLKKLLVYTTNTEVAGVEGNYADRLTQSGENGVGENFIEINATTRVRGLASATNTRNYFQSEVPMDAYNTSRVVINRGANSILFGIGSPAGVINTNVISAMFEDSNEVDFSYGSYGSMRSSLDINRVLLEDKLAVRVAGLYEDQKYQQKPAFERDERLFATVTAKPIEDLTIKFNFETASIAANPPRQFPPSDYVSSWWDPLAAPEGQIQPRFNAQETNGGGDYGSSYFGPSAVLFKPAVIWSDTGSGEVNASRNPNGTDGFLILRNANYSPTRNDSDMWFTLRGTGRNQQIYDGGKNADIASFFVNEVVTDPAIFDYRNNLLEGDNKRFEKDFYTYNATAEYLFLDRKAGIELAFDKQNYNDDRRYLFETDSRRYAISMDVVDVLGNGEPNPNFGRMFVSYNGGLYTQAETEADTYRATGFVKLNDNIDDRGFFGKLLGRHTFTGIYESREEKNLFMNGPQYIFGDNYADYNTKPDGSLVNNGMATVNSATYVYMGGYYYLGDSFANASGPQGGVSIGHLPPVNIQDSYTFTTYSYNLDDWDTTTYGIRRNPIIGATRSRTERDSQAIVGSSKFLDDHIVATYGWRTDKVKSYSEDAPRADDNSRIIDDPDFQVADTLSADPYEGTTFSWGVVGHVPHKFVDMVPGVSSFTLHYGEAENAVADSTARHDFFGRPLDPPSGVTEEMGFAVSFLNNRLSVRANWYETSQILRNETRLNAMKSLISYEMRVFNWADDIIAENFYDQDDIEMLRNYPDFPQVIKDAWQIEEGANGDLVSTAPDDLTITSDGVSKGFELEVMGNVTSNWTVSFNASQQKVTNSNSGPDIEEYLYGEYNRAALFEEDAFGRFPSEVSNYFSLGERFENLYETPYITVRKQDGSVSSDQVREWRANLLTRYSFAKDGPLKGWTVGGGFRWQDEISVGYPVIFDNDLGQYVSDVSNPIFGPDELNVDMFVGYKTKVFQERVDWSLRLYVKNLVAQDDLIPVVANPDGSFPVYRIAADRTFELSSNFKF